MNWRIVCNVFVPMLQTKSNSNGSLVAVQLPSGRGLVGFIYKQIVGQRPIPRPPILQREAKFWPTGTAPRGSRVPWDPKMPIPCWIGVSLVSGRNLYYRMVFLKIFWHQGYTTTLDPLGAVPVGQNLASLCRIGGLGIGLWPTITPVSDRVWPLASAPEVYLKDVFA